jgi:N-terminal domain of galactosyltransferase
MIDGQRLSITTGSLNRLDPLKRSLPTWLACPEPDEIVIVDWGNAVPLRESLKEFKDPRIIIARAEDQRYWHNSKCHNLELRLATGDLLLRLDNDCILKPTFFVNHRLQDGCFFAGNWKTVPIEVDDKRSLTGTLYIRRDNAIKINGYNERLIHYGHEDDELYERLVSNGMIRFDIDISTLEHIPHSDQQRYANLKIAPKLQPQMNKTPIHQRTRTAHDIKMSLIQRSKEIASESPWTTKDQMTRWNIKTTDANHLTCEEISNASP